LKNKDRFKKINVLENEILAPIAVETCCRRSAGKIATDSRMLLDKKQKNESI
jgi:hypothetical protein